MVTASSIRTYGASRLVFKIGARPHVKSDTLKHNAVHDIIYYGPQFLGVDGWIFSLERKFTTDYVFVLVDRE